MKYENISKLIDMLEPDLEEMQYVVSPEQTLGRHDLTVFRPQVLLDNRRALFLYPERCDTCQLHRLLRPYERRTERDRPLGAQPASDPYRRRDSARSRHARRTRSRIQCCVGGQWRCHFAGVRWHVCAQGESSAHAVRDESLTRNEIGRLHAHRQAQLARCIQRRYKLGRAAATKHRLGLLPPSDTRLRPRRELERLPRIL